MQIAYDHAYCLVQASTQEQPVNQIIMQHPHKNCRDFPYAEVGTWNNTRELNPDWIELSSVIPREKSGLFASQSKTLLLKRVTNNPCCVGIRKNTMERDAEGRYKNRNKDFTVIIFACRGS